MQQTNEQKLEAALTEEIAKLVSDSNHPSRVAYERAREAHPDGGDAARVAFYRFLHEEKVKRDAGVDRSGEKVPLVHPNGVPYCSHNQCPKYALFQGRCTEEDVEDPTVCIPAVRDMVIELDARKDAADPAFDEIVQLCGLAKTWEYPGQVIRDVKDALKKRDERIAELEAERAKREKHPMAPDVCSECKWTNTNLMNYSLTPNNGGHWLCHGCAARVIDETSGLRAWRDGIESGLRALLESVDVEHRSEGAMRGAELTIERLRTDLAQALQKLIVAGQAPGVRVEKSIDDYEADIAALVDQNMKLQTALKYARDRRGGTFDYDEWSRLVEAALDNKIPPSALEDAHTKEQRAWDAVRSMREKLSEARERLQLAELAARTILQAVGANDAPDVAPPEEAEPVEGTKTCGCSLKYRELAPGIHAKYCALAGLPLERL